MKYLTFILSFFALSVIAKAGEPTKQNAIKFATTEHDFGNLPQGKPVSFDFEFENTGQAPIELENVQASCGCTTPIWTKEPILFGKKGVIKAQYNMAREGLFDKTITVTAKSGEQVILHIKGNAIAQKQGAEDADATMIGGKTE
ncbi:MAG: DUF1573 domain-containing protein [Chitinophagales bacterium]